MNLKIIIPIILIVAIVLGIKFSLDHNNNQKELIRLEEKRIEEGEQNKTLLQSEIDKLKSEINVSSDKITELNEQISKLKDDNSKSSALNAQLRSQTNSLRSQLNRELNKVSKAKSAMMALVNEKMTGLLEFRVKTISIFNDDSSFAYLTGRRNYLTIDSKNNINMERVLYFSSTGQYLQKLYQDKDNGNNRFIITETTVNLNDLDLSKASVVDNSKKEKLAFEKDFKEEYYVSLFIPVKESKGSIAVINGIEYNKERFDKKSDEKVLEIYTTSENEAEQVLSLLKMLNSIM